MLKNKKNRERFEQRQGLKDRDPPGGHHNSSSDIHILQHTINTRHPANQHHHSSGGGHYKPSHHSQPPAHPSSVQQSTPSHQQRLKRGGPPQPHPSVVPGLNNVNHQLVDAPGSRSSATGGLAASSVPLPTPNGEGGSQDALRPSHVKRGNQKPHRPGTFLSILGKLSLGCYTVVIYLY